MTAQAAGGARRVAQALVVAICGLLLALSGLGLALFAIHGPGRPDLIDPQSWSAERLIGALADLGVPVEWWIGFMIGLEAMLITVSVAAAVFLLQGAVTWFRLYVAFVLIFFATAGGSGPTVLGGLYPMLTEPALAVQGLAWIALFTLAYVFPDGRFMPPFTRWLPLVWVALWAMTGLVPSAADGPVSTAILLALAATCIAAQTYRYIKVSGPVQRQQTKWVMYSIALRVAFVIFGVSYGFAVDTIAELAIVNATSYLLAAMIPVAIAIAIVRHRLFDIDVVISRTLVYLTLTAFVVGAYIAIVAGLGALWKDGTGTVLPLLATGLVAVAFSPVRERVQRAVNRLIYGQRDEPYAVLTELGRRLGSALPAEAVPQTIVDSVRAALKLPYAAIAMPGNGSFAIGGVPTGTDLATFPLRYENQPVGDLAVEPRPGDRLGGADRRLLSVIARQAGIAVHAARVSADLRESTERLRTAREEERARVYRDLHDGLGPTMASVYQRIDAARASLNRDAASAQRLLTGVREQITLSIEDIRRLVYSLRPPILDDLGLVPAIREACDELSAQPDRLTVTLRVGSISPTLPAAVEVSAYRIVREGLTNVVRHARARTCVVEIELRGSPPLLHLRVSDDGVGISPGLRPAGAGLRSMRERAEQIGGTVKVRAGEPTGTVIEADLPIHEGDPT